VLLWRTTAAIVLLAIEAAAAQEQSVPLPQAKPIIGEQQEAEKPVVEKPVVEKPVVEKPVSSEACLRDLKAIGVVAAPAPGVAGSGECPIEDAVALEAIDTRAGKVTLPGRPVLACRFAGVLGAWLSEVVSPVAASLLGSPIATIATGPGYQCRSRAGGRLSEHAFGNALDISSVRLVDGRNILIETLPTARNVEREFLRGISASACGYFTTVLGPGSDADHADHLHVDLAQRRSAEYRICVAR
jgi:hypothetical protein